MAKAKSLKPVPSSSPGVIVFGLDAAGKAKAGRFPGKDASVAKKAARALDLAFCDVNRPKLIEIATKIPVGRLHAQGKAFLPAIRRDLYDELAAAVRPLRSAAAVRKAHPARVMTTAKAGSKVFIVLGFDRDLKPVGARYRDPNEEHLTKLSEELKLNLYQLKSAELIDWMKDLPVGKLQGSGPLAVPEIPQALYSDVIIGIAEDPAAVPCGKIGGPLPAEKGSPENWEAIAVGHLVVAQESPGYGWYDAIVVGRKNGLLTLRYRDCPKLPEFHRHYRAVALLSRDAQ